MRNSAYKYGLPTSVEEVANLLIDDLSLKERVRFASMAADNLKEVYPKVGAYIDEEFRIFTGNNMLFNDCTKLLSDKKIDGEPAMAIIYRAWEILKSTHRLRLVVSNDEK